MLTAIAFWGKQGSASRGGSGTSPGWWRRAAPEATAARTGRYRVDFGGTGGKGGEEEEEASKRGGAEGRGGVVEGLRARAEKRRTTATGKRKRRPPPHKPPALGRPWSCAADDGPRRSHLGPRNDAADGDACV